MENPDARTASFRSHSIYLDSLKLLSFYNMAKYYLYSSIYDLVATAGSIEEVRTMTGSSRDKIKKHLDTKHLLECGLMVKTTLITKVEKEEDDLTVGNYFNRRRFSKEDIEKSIEKCLSHS